MYKNKASVIMMYVVFCCLPIQAVINDPEQLVSPISFQERIKELFSKVNKDGRQIHHYSAEREKELNDWLGTNSKGPASQANESNLSFLEQNWGNRHFRIFDGIDGAEEYLNQNHDVGYVIRLSTTKSGYITITFRNENSLIFHSRYLVEKGKITINNREYTLEQLIVFLKTPSVGTYINE